MITDINSEDRLVQQTFAKHLENVLGWESIYAHNNETFGPNGTPGRLSEREVVLARDLRAALERLNPDLPAEAREQAVEKLTRVDFARSLVQHNREFDDFIRAGFDDNLTDYLSEHSIAMHDWTQNTTTQAEVRVCIFDNLWRTLPRPPFTEEETEAVASRVYDFVWQQSESGVDLVAA